MNLNFYTINYPEDEKSLCSLELKCIFGKAAEKKYLFSEEFIDPSRSVFIKECIKIKYMADSLADLEMQIRKDCYSLYNFKIKYVKHEANVIPYEQRLSASKQISSAIDRTSVSNHSETILGLTNVDNKWILGEFQRNIPDWMDHNQKPSFYSNALGVRIARSVVNIAVGNNTDLKVIDPCCGIGTVVIEALSMDINIAGYEINPQIAAGAKRNLQYFGFDNVITTGDMHKIKDFYDVAIVDLPYGLFTPITIEDRDKIIATASKLAKKIVFLSLEDIDEKLTTYGLDIVDRCTVSKGKFTRQIMVCIQKT